MEDTGVPSHEATNFCLTKRVVYRLAQRPRRRECCGCVCLTLWYPFTAIQRVERLPLAVPEGSQLSQIFALRPESSWSGAVLQNVFLQALSALKCHVSVLPVDNSLSRYPRKLLCCIYLNKRQGRGSGGLFPAVKLKGLASTPSQAVWDLWWAKCHWDRIISDYLSFCLPVSLHRCWIILQH
jgi:hypothetical protein